MKIIPTKQQVRDSLKDLGKLQEASLDSLWLIIQEITQLKESFYN